MKATSYFPAMLGVLLLLGLVLASPAGAAIGVSSFDLQLNEGGGEPSTAAGGHPFEVSTAIGFDSHEEEGRIYPDGSARNISVDLPQGLIGNPTAVTPCPEEKLEVAQCPVASQVGVATLIAPASGFPKLYFPLYNIVAPPGAAAEFGFFALNVPVHLEAKVLAGEGYGVRVSVVDLPQSLAWTESTISFWGVPASPVHDGSRGTCLTLFGPSGDVCEAGTAAVPFLSNPTRCSSELTTMVHVNSWQDPAFSTKSSVRESGGVAVGLDGCESVPFKPSARLTLGSTGAGKPSSLEVAIDVPHQTDNPVGRESSHVKDVMVDLPEGMTVNPSLASGLGACAPSQIALNAATPAACPEASRIGSVEIGTPLLADPLTGGVYVATQGANPFNSLIAMYLAVADPKTGVVLKLAGKITPDPVTGELHASFEDNPQLPFDSLRMKLKGGSRAPLVLPASCGTYRGEVRLTPWARPSEVVSTQSQIRVSTNCDQIKRFGPDLEVGSIDPTAGSHSPFLLRVTREEGEQNLAKIEATLPEGLLAKLKGVAFCGDAQAVGGDCPPASQVGRAIVGAGSGSDPIYVPEAGKAPTAVYLGGPYKGAPYSLVVKVPAQAGPFDLGTVVVRNALRIDPLTTQVTAESDPLPQILQGIPIAYRDVRVEIDRPKFILNPTSCREQRVTSTLTSATGATAQPSERFQVAGCGKLGFEPKLKLSLKGKMKRTGNPALKAVLKAPKGQANIAKTTVALPQAMFIDNAHISNPCTRVQFDAGSCPKGSILGRATAVTPLLDKPLSGPVYFRSNGGERELPDLVADLGGQIHVTLVGFIDSVKTGPESSRVRTRFLNVPDAPVSKFTIKLAGGKRGLIENSKNLCSFTPKAKVQMTGQNGKAANSNLKLGTSCGREK